MNTLMMLCLLLARQGEKVKVVTTLPVLADLAGEVGGDRVEVVALASASQDPHYILGKPTYMQIASKADLFVELGMQLDNWCWDVVANSGNVGIQRGTKGYVTAAADCWKGEFPRELSRAWGDIHADGNPHVWLDPVNAVAMARTIAGALGKIDIDHAADYDARADDFETRIYEAMIGKECYAAMKPEHVRRLAVRNALLPFIEGNETLAASLGGWAKKAQALKGVKVVSYHKTYFYFAARFGFEIVAELEENPGIPPPPKHKAEVVRRMKAEGVKVILNDEFYPRGAADSVASETGAKVIVTHIDVGAEEGVDDYFAMIDRMLDQLTEAVR